MGLQVNSWSETAGTCCIVLNSHRLIEREESQSIVIGMCACVCVQEQSRCFVVPSDNNGWPHLLLNVLL